MFLRLRSWLTDTARSAYDPSFYAERAKNNYPRRFWHLYGVLFLTSLLTGIVFAVWVALSLPLVHMAVTSAEKELPALYPAEMVVTIKEGAASTNMQEPVVIDFPPAWQQWLRENQEESLEEGEAFPHLLTIDTAGSVEDFADYQSLALLTEKTFAMIDKDNGVRMFPIDKETDMTINKEMYDRALTSVLPFLRKVPSLLSAFAWASVLVLPFLLAGLRLLGYLIYLLPMAGLVWIIAIFIDRKRSYWELYRLSIYGLTLPLIYGLVESLANVHFRGVFELIFLVWMGYVLKVSTRSPLPKKGKRVE